MWLWLVLGVVCAGGALWVFAPREPVVTSARFDASVLEDGVSSYLIAAEARVPDVRVGVEKRVIWAGVPEARTPWAVVYVHGFSAASEEIRPVPDRVAAALGANLVFTRLTGHGRDSAAMAEATVGAWMHDMAEALAIAARIGDRVLVISTSTGGTLTALALHEDMGAQVTGAVFVSPNFRLQAPKAFMLTWPGARRWVPLVVGKELGFEPRALEHERFWTARYASEAVVPMAAAVKALNSRAHGVVTTPALFAYDLRDEIVDAQKTKAVAAQWGGPAELYEVSLEEGDDPGFHVIAGDILSPGMTGPMTEKIVAWARALVP